MLLRAVIFLLLAGLAMAPRETVANTLADGAAGISWQVYAFRSLNNPNDDGGVFLADGTPPLIAFAATTGGFDSEMNSTVVEFEAFSFFDDTIWEADILFDLGASAFLEAIPPQTNLAPGSFATGTYHVSQIGAPWSIDFNVKATPSNPEVFDFFSPMRTIILGPSGTVKFEVKASASAYVPVPAPTSIAGLIGGLGLLLGVNSLSRQRSSNQA